MIRQVNLDTTDFRGLSSDTKPSGVGNGSTFLEMDTGAKYMYDAENDEWHLMPGGGGGGGGDNTEVISARTGADGTKYGSLKGRLDAENEDLNEKIDDEISLVKSQIEAIQPGLTDNAKLALLACFQKVAWVDDQGQTYYDALHDALYPTPTSITAVFTQGGATIYDTQTLDDLRQYLVVTATFDDGTEKEVSSYTLSGTLTAGTSTITVTYQELTTTFTVTVTHNAASLTAVYTQTGTVYTTDSLDSLKTDLVVTYYADAQSAGVVVPSTDYMLSGTLAEGTSTITVSYLNTSATFNVTVTDGSYIEAVFTQPQTTIYTDDSLNSLKSNLVVTYYAQPGATGTVLASSAYTLIGTLTEGTSVITAEYQGLTDTFNVTVVSSVPSGYTRLKSVITDGLQYIDLGVNETQVESARYAMMITGVAAGAESYGYGQHILSSSNTFFPLLKDENGTTQIMRNRKGNQHISSGSVTYAWTENVKYSVEAYLNGGNAVTFNGTQVFTLNAGSSASASNNFFLFTYGGNVSAGRYRFCGHLYYMVVYDSNGNVLRNLIPAKNSSDVVGLYDTVTSTFYTSNTTYPLAAGEVAA